MTIKLPSLNEALIFHVPNRRAPLMVWGDERQTRQEAMIEAMRANNCTVDQVRILCGDEKIRAYRAFEIGATRGWLTHH